MLCETTHLRSRRMLSEHCLLMKVVATPVFPQRPVRPIRCTYVSISFGMSKLITCCKRRRMISPDEKPEASSSTCMVSFFHVWSLFGHCHSRLYAGQDVLAQTHRMSIIPVFLSLTQHTNTHLYIWEIQTLCGNVRCNKHVCLAILELFHRILTLLLRFPSV